jgi:hypothetical protein
MEVTSTKFGKILHDGSNTDCRGDCAQFKGPAYRYLSLLEGLTGSAAYSAVLKASADAIWNLARNPSEDLFSVSWSGPSMSVFSEPQVAAAVMALNLFAESEGPFPGTGAPSSQYEAEDATISGVGLEAAHAGFTGWGYVAGWNGDGQSVSFKVRVPAAGVFDIAFRYAGGAGNASRRVIINGAVASSNLLFPGTGSWSSYATVSVRKTLPAGVGVITVAQSAAAGNGNFLNLDHLRLKPLAPFLQRGDPNADGVLDLTDAVSILLHLFGQRPAAVRCRQAADADGNGTANIADAIYLLRFLFQLGPPPPAPFPDCGPIQDPAGLDCAAYPPCE